MGSNALYDAPTLELLAHCQVELDRLRAQLESLDSPTVQSRLSRVERALSWLDAGHYGYCGVCDRRIADDDLRANPERLVCDRCAMRTRGASVMDEAPTW